jgi:vacuolar-type H+-ATPase subunit H
MGEADLKRLLDAEKNAERSIEEAKKRSQDIIRKAEKDMVRSRERRLGEFEASSAIKLDEARRLAMEESARIRKDGVAMADDMRNSAKGRMETAVEKVLETVKENL